MLARFRHPFFRHPYLLLTLTMLFWSGNMVLARAIRGDVPPMALAFWRWAIALLLLLPLALPHWRSQWPRLKQRWKTVTILGMLGVGSYNTFAYVALQHTAATNALLLNSFIPVATLSLAWLLLKNPLRPIEGLGVALSLCGVATIVLRGSSTTLATLNLNIGDLWMLAAVFCWALYTVGLQWRPLNIQPLFLMAAFTCIGVLLLAPAYLWEMAAGRHLQLNPGSIAGLLYVGILPSFVGYVFYNRAVGEVGAGKASLFIHLMPVFGILLAALFLNETPQTYHLVGIALIFIGIYLTTAALQRRRP